MNHIHGVPYQLSNRMEKEKKLQLASGYKRLSPRNTRCFLVTGRNLIAMTNCLCHATAIKQFFASKKNFNLCGKMTFTGSVSQPLVIAMKHFMQFKLLGLATEFSNLTGLRKQFGHISRKFVRRTDKYSQYGTPYL